MTVDRRRLTKTFFDLVRIDSLTFDEADVIAFISRELASLGIKAQSDSAAEKIGGNSGNLIAHLPGDRNKPAIFINCHVDTVEPGRGIEPRETDGIIAAAGETILGADDKAGAAALLELARVLVSRPTETRGHVDLVFSVAEEKGLLGVKNLDHTLVTGEYGFVLDGAGRVGDITITAPYQDTIEAVFRRTRESIRSRGSAPSARLRRPSMPCLLGGSMIGRRPTSASSRAVGRSISSPSELLSKARPAAWVRRD